MDIKFKPHSFFDFKAAPIRLALLVLGALLSTACSTTTSGSARLHVGNVVAPPDGMFEFCIGRLEECGLENVLASEAEHKDTVKARKREPMSDEALMRLARQVNTQINQALTYRTDLEFWNRTEVWALPLSEEGVSYGDCEDYALEKRQALIELGVPLERLRLATAWSQSTGLHAVLIVRLEAGDYVLDNATPHILHVGQTFYDWRSMQTGTSLISWAQASTTAQPMLVADSDTLSPSIYSGSGVN